MRPSANPLGPVYQNLRVAELSTDPGGELTGLLLASMGATVVKVEPPEGAPSRAVGPFAENKPSENRSLNYWYYNSNKQSVVIDYRSAKGRKDLDDLLSASDVFITTLSLQEQRELGLDYDELCARHERLIVLSVTPFGLDGPWSEYQSSALVGLAAGGPLNSCGYDDLSLPPICPGGNQAFHTAASFAHQALLIALLERQQSGRGQVVDVSMHESCAVTVELANPYWFYQKAIVRRQACRHAQPVRTEPWIFECADGKWVSFIMAIIVWPAVWKSTIEWMDSKGLAEDLTAPEYADMSHRQAHYGHIKEVVERFFLSIPSSIVFHEGQARTLPISVVNAPEDLLDDAHFNARGFFVDVEHEGVGTFKYPGNPYTLLGPQAVRRSRAPDLGEHTSEVLSALRAQVAALDA